MLHYQASPASGNYSAILEAKDSRSTVRRSREDYWRRRRHQRQTSGGGAAAWESFDQPAEQPGAGGEDGLSVALDPGMGEEPVRRAPRSELGGSPSGDSTRQDERARQAAGGPRRSLRCGRRSDPRRRLPRAHAVPGQRRTGEASERSAATTDSIGAPQARGAPADRPRRSLGLRRTRSIGLRRRTCSIWQFFQFRALNRSR